MLGVWLLQMCMIDKCYKCLHFTDVITNVKSPKYLTKLKSSCHLLTLIFWISKIRVYYVKIYKKEGSRYMRLPYYYQVFTTL